MSPRTPGSSLGRSTGPRPHEPDPAANAATITARNVDAIATFPLSQLHRPGAVKREEDGDRAPRWVDVGSPYPRSRVPRPVLARNSPYLPGKKSYPPSPLSSSTH